MGSPARPVSESPEWGFTVGAMPFAKHKLLVSSCSCQHTHVQKQRPGSNSEFRVWLICISFFFSSSIFLREKINFCPSTRGHVVCLGVTMWHRHDTVVLEAGIYSMGNAAEIFKKHHTTKCRVSRHDSCNCAAKPARSIVGWCTWCTEYSVNPSDLPSLQHLHHTP